MADEVGVSEKEQAQERKAEVFNQRTMEMRGTRGRGNVLVEKWYSFSMSGVLDKMGRS